LSWIGVILEEIGRMEISQLISLCVASLVIVIVAIFKRQEREITNDFFDRTQTIIDAITMHKQQISIRQKALNVYDFLKYNISEALLKQSNIKWDV
jgi:hypothetical protein